MDVGDTAVCMWSIVVIWFASNDNSAHGMQGLLLGKYLMNIVMTTPRTLLCIKKGLENIISVASVLLL